MNFFNKNLKQDKLFIEVNNRLSLSYWMASDIDHFVENFPELINKDILKQIIKNSNSLNAFFEQTEEDISKLNGVHKECALEIYHFVKVCMEEFECINAKSSQDVPEDSKLSKIIDLDINLRDQLTQKYLLNSDVEYHRNMAFKFYAKSLWGLTDFISYLSQKDDQELSKTALKFSLHNLNNAERAIDVGMNFLEHSNTSTKELRIAMKDNNCLPTQSRDKYASEYYDLQVNFNIILKELFFVTKEFYAQFEDDQDPSDAEFKLFSHESNQYLSKLNQVGFEISKLMLTIMDRDLPNYQLLSEMTIKNHLDYIRVS